MPRNPIPCQHSAPLHSADCTQAVATPLPDNIRENPRTYCDLCCSSEPDPVGDGALVICACGSVLCIQHSEEHECSPIEEGGLA